MRDRRSLGRADLWRRGRNTVVSPSTGKSQINSQCLAAAGGGASK